MKALIVTPAYSHTHQDLDRVVRESGILAARLYGHSDLPRVRSILLEHALERGAERVILIDADTIPSREALDWMAQTAEVTPARAVWGLYPLRDADRWSVNPEDAQAAAQAIADGRCFRIRSGGLGFCAIHRESLLRVGASLDLIGEERGFRWRPFCVPIVRGSRYYADDASLCLRLQETGTETWCHPTARAGHAVTTVVTELRAP